MEKRVLRVVSILFFMIVATGCSMFGPKPVSKTRWFYGNTLQFELQGEGTIEIMNKAAKHYKQVAFKGKEDDPSIERAIYELYVRADKGDKDHVITEKEAREFWELYQRQFDSHFGTGPIHFQ